jgi:hypothetical protein
MAVWKRLILSLLRGSSPSLSWRRTDRMNAEAIVEQGSLLVSYQPSETSLKSVHCILAGGWFWSLPRLPHLRSGPPGCKGRPLPPAARRHPVLVQGHVLPPDFPAGAAPGSALVRLQRPPVGRQIGGPGSGRGSEGAHAGRCGKLGYQEGRMSSCAGSSDGLLEPRFQLYRSEGSINDIVCKEIRLSQIVYAYPFLDILGSNIYITAHCKKYICVESTRGT